MYAEIICKAIEEQNANLHTALTQGRECAFSELKKLDMKPHEIVYQISKFKEFAKKEGII